MGPAVETSPVRQERARGGWRSRPRRTGRVRLAAGGHGGGRGWDNCPGRPGCPATLDGRPGERANGARCEETEWLGVSSRAGHTPAPDPLPPLPRRSPPGSASWSASSSGSWSASVVGGPLAGTGGADEATYAALLREALDALRVAEARFHAGDPAPAGEQGRRALRLLAQADDQRRDDVDVAFFAVEAAVFAGEGEGSRALAPRADAADPRPHAHSTFPSPAPWWPSTWRGDRPPR